MPSYLADDNSVRYHQPADIGSIHRSSQYRFTQGKAHGLTAQPSQQSNSTANDSFDESSTHSTQISDVSDPHPELNGSMDGLPNGTHGEKANGVIRTEPVQTNGVGLKTLPDRSVHQQSSSINGTKDAETPVPSPVDGNARTSLSSAAAASIQHSPVEMYLQPPNKTDVRTVDSTSPPQVNHAHASSSFTPAPPTASGALQPPPGAGLKHRHTLEVPKVTPARGSRDGVETGFASGRFSPTTATTGARRTSLSLVRRNTRSLHSDLPRDEIIPDEDALRWAEAYRQKRASKRKKIEREDDDRVLVGTKVDENHANWVTAYNMLTGIRVSVSRTNAKLDRPLTDADFEAKQKSTFDIAGNELVPSAKYDFKFKDYAPWVFRHLRALFRLDPADYLMSLTGKYILSELGSPGKSGSFFYFSRDYKYIIKTIHHSEHKFLRKILKDYYQHVTDNPNTLLSQFYGLHRVKMPYGKKIHFVVMNNLFPPHRDIHETFDLKGSTIGRDYKEDDLGKNPRATLKDLNWLRRHRHLELGMEKKRLFLDQLHKDVRLLQKLQIMDYSLLIGIHDVRRGNEENLRDKTLQVFSPGGDKHEESDPAPSVLMRTPSKLESQRKARELRQMIKAERPVPMGQTTSRMPNELEEGHNKAGFVFNQDDGGFAATHEDNSPGDEVYYLGVIDCLTHYGVIKKLEHFWKGLSSDRTQISALPPQEYGERFMNFISGVTMSPEEAQREAQERDAANAAAAAAGEHPDRVGSWGSRRRSTSTNIPPMPNYQPPSPPTNLLSGQKSPEQELTLQRAEHQAHKSEKHGAREDDVPDRTLKTVSSVITESDDRPLTPAKDGDERQAGFGNPLLGNSKGRAPPTPPKTATLKPESADSGYGVTGLNTAAANALKSATGSQKSLKPRSSISRESLDKALPPLPRSDAIHQEVS
ncbi:SAICAR synthase-like protein [Coniochaeta sp. PMI_546]|nr:SAICAR synthase-like protein [Coniochaeta sp. PMI_546]